VFFDEALAGRDATPLRAVDVGTGANLYPAFASLPFAASLELVERSSQSVRWLLRQQSDGFATNWDAFIDAYGNQVTYKRYFGDHDPRDEFRSKVSIREGSVFDLPVGEWDLGTMFFTACSLSAEHDEFGDAVRGFVRSLRPNAPFAAAFMTNSDGYHVQGRHFPAVPVELDDIHTAFDGIAGSVAVTAINSADPVRHQVGMALALGYAR
jgi:hypothetical protein